MKKIVNFLLIIILAFVCFYVIQTRNFNGLKLAQLKDGITKVCRDKNEKYNGEWSYKIESKDYNDYMIYKTIKVNPNTAYKVSCMVKTKDIVPENKDSCGFNIGLKDNLEKSRSLVGTNDWTELNFYFDSKNNENIDIAFRLGENGQNCKGTAWIANLNIEVGRKKVTNEWDFAVFMIDNINAKVNGKEVNKRLTNRQINTIETSFSEFKHTIYNFTNGNIIAEYDIIKIDEPLLNISYDDDQTGYFIAQEDVYKLIENDLYNKNKNYDHIFIVANLGDVINNKQIDWLGLGGMVFDSMGYSNIRISDETINAYEDSNSNFFSEEIILHEFLHTLERNSKELGNDTIALHDYKKYGYEDEKRYGQKKWYLDYLTNNIKNTKNGLKEEIYYTQPVSEKNFKKIKIITDYLYDEQNIIQKICEKISRII